MHNILEEPQVSISAIHSLHKRPSLKGRRSIQIFEENKYKYCLNYVSTSKSAFTPTQYNCPIADLFL